ncbi:MAG TPA: hypothetical protein VFV23_12530 [Verrucomicrobiae bacterium]|nr:hypothetical protein [Verrucomicrobiae bacterium]
MSDVQFNPSARNSSGKPAGIGAVIFLILFATPFAGFGLFAAIQGVRKIIAGQIKDGAILCLFGLFFSTVGFGLMAGAIFGRKKSKQTAELQARFADKPWMLRADWADGKIKSSTANRFKIYLFMGIAFSGIGGVSTVFALPEVWQKHNYPALIVLLFPLVGIGFLIAFINAWRSRKRFGDCFFELAQIPIPIGSVLEGMIQTGEPLRLENELHLKFSCVRRVTTGSGKNRSTQEKVLWQDEKIYLPQAALNQTGTGTGIPVHFKLPADQPQSFTSGDESVFWRLEARSKLTGPDFHAAFDTPVFNVAGAAMADEDDVDPTAALQAPIDEVRREEHSRIRVTDGPNGREFYFPAARNIGSAIFTTVLAAVFSGGAILMHHFHVPLIFPVFVGFFGFILIFIAFSLWFKSSRVTINSSGVRAENGYLIFRHVREFAVGDVAQFALKTGMTSGTKVFSDIKLIKRDDGDSFAANKEKFQQTGQLPPLKFKIDDPSGITVASSITSAMEAKWLAQEMNKALGRDAKKASAIL